MKPEGIVEKEADGYKYVYQFKDHLGNVRLSYKDADKNGSISQSEIVQEKNYYPFGLQHKGYNDDTRGRNHQYGYNGIELTENLGLNLYEMDLRQYDPAIARWTSIDPVTFHSKSPYNAFDNNPIYWADPSGAYSTAEWMKDNGVTNNDLVNVYQASSNNESSDKTSDPQDDIHIDKKTKKATVIKTNDDHDKIFVNSKQIASAKKGFFLDVLKKSSYSVHTMELNNTEVSEMKNLFTELADSGFLGSLTYNIANSFYLSAQVVDGDMLGKDLINPLTGYRAFTNLDGTAQYDSSERTLSFVTSAMPFLAETKLFSSVRTLNTSQFSSLFKGTFISRAKPAARGIMNRVYNSGVKFFNKYSTYINSGTYMDAIIYAAENNKK